MPSQPLIGSPSGPKRRSTEAKAEAAVASSRGRVVVGVDGSSHSRQALRIAADEARLRGAVLAVVHAVYWDNSGAELVTPTNNQLVEWGRKLVAADWPRPG
jgi:nucleotide-binding universal stress UspA family protein